jgi:hypothetical protein
MGSLRFIILLVLVVFIALVLKDIFYLLLSALWVFKTPVLILLAIIIVGNLLLRRKKLPGVKNTE